MDKNIAFSLIELMVVIAIVSILATVATPAYKLYITKTKLNMANNYVQTIVNESIRYYNDNGVFANAAQIGLPTDGDPEQTPDPTSNGYLQGNVANMTLGPRTATCNTGNASAYISNFGEGDGVLDPTSDTVVLQYMFIDIDGIIVKKCQYIYYKGGYVGGTTPSGSFISGCVNRVDNPGYEAAGIALANSCT